MDFELYNYENAEIIDSRDPSSLNKNVVITCEHATNDLPNEYLWTDSDKKNFAVEHWGYDIGALELSKYISKELNSVIVHSKFSQLLIDVNKTLTSETLIRKVADNKEIDLNKSKKIDNFFTKDINKNEVKSRILKYHYSYYNALRHISNKIDPSYVFSIHSFNPMYKGQASEVEVCIATSISDDFANTMIHEFKNKGWLTSLNDPWNGKEGIFFANDSSLTMSNVSRKRVGITFQFRNDILEDKYKILKLKNDIIDIFARNCV